MTGEKVIDADGVEHQVYRRYVEGNYNFIADDQLHSFNVVNIGTNKIIKADLFVRRSTDDLWTPLPLVWNGTIDIHYALSRVYDIYIAYTIQTKYEGNRFDKYRAIIEYYK